MTSPVPGFLTAAFGGLLGAIAGYGISYAGFTLYDRMSRAEEA